MLILILIGFKTKFLAESRRKASWALQLTVKNLRGEEILLTVIDVRGGVKNCSFWRSSITKTHNSFMPEKKRKVGIRIMSLNLCNLIQFISQNRRRSIRSCSG